MASGTEDTRPISEHELPPRILPPILHLGVVAGLAAVAWLLALPESVTAALALAYGLGVAAVHPLNGLSLVVLAIPFFLGEPRRPGFLVLDGLILLTLAGWGWHLLRRRVERPWVPYALPLTAFVLASLLALPLNARELLTDLWVYTPLDLVRQTVSENTVPHVYYLRVVFSLLTSVALFGLAASLAHPAFLAALAWAATPLYLVLALAGLLRWGELISFGGGYLSLSSGVYRGDPFRDRLVSVAWNPDYFAQYLILTLPFVLFALLAGGRPWRRGVGTAAFVAGTIALALTYQRAAYLAYLAVLLGFSLLWVRAQEGDRGPGRRAWGPTLGLLGLVVAVVVVDLAANVGVVRRFQEIWVAAASPHRPHLWRTAGAMLADQPLLGVGTGRFSYFFRDYSPISPREFGPFWGTAHNLYLQLGAERGLLGLGAFLWLVLAALGHGWRALRGVRAGLDPLGLALIAVVAWLVYGVFQSTFYIHSIEVGFWALLGFMAACARPHAAPQRLGRRAWIVVLAGLVLAGGLRGYQASQYPFHHPYEAGFYRWERQPDDTPARWTGRRAALAVTPEGPTLLLDVAVPTPVVSHRPQRLTVWIEGRQVTEVTLADPHWRTLRISLEPAARPTVLLTLRTAYTFNPQAAGVGADARDLGVMLKPPRWE